MKVLQIQAISLKRLSSVRVNYSLGGRKIRGGSFFRVFLWEVIFLGYYWFSRWNGSNSFCNWIRILFLVRTCRIWFFWSSSSPVYSGTGFAIPVTRSTVDWRLKAPGKPDSNEEKNSNPIPETVIWVLLLLFFLSLPHTLTIINLQISPPLTWLFIYLVTNIAMIYP